MRISLIAAMLSACIFARAETTPLATPLLEEKETTIECELKEAPSVGEVPVFESQKEAKATIGTYHYKLWLPKGYNSEPQRRWPCAVAVVIIS